MSIHFEYWNLPRGTGATTDMLWEALKQAHMNPDVNVYCLFYGYQLAAMSAETLPYKPINLPLTSVNMQPIGRKGMVYVDGSVKELSGSVLMDWEKVAM